VIDTLDLFEPLDDQLLAVLRSLSRQDWKRQTIAGAWTVREVAAHLLDTPLRRLSFVRDGWAAEVDIRSDADLVRFVNAMNAEGVRTLGRLSPAVLIDLLALVAPQLRDHLRASAPDGAAAFPVSWAGESASAHWFDVAREYTVRWHHQAQIRLAVGALDPLMTARFYEPVVATFMRAVPHACRSLEAADGARVDIDVAGIGGGSWAMTRVEGVWRLAPSSTGAVEQGPPTATVTIPAALAWRLFTKGASPAEVAETCPWQGDKVLATTVLAARAIVG
jgi:hypothetical protein